MGTNILRVEWSVCTMRKRGPPLAYTIFAWKGKETLTFWGGSTFWERSWRKTVWRTYIHRFIHTDRHEQYIVALRLKYNYYTHVTWAVLEYKFDSFILFYSFITYVLAYQLYVSELTMAGGKQKQTYVFENSMCACRQYCQN